MGLVPTSAENRYFGGPHSTLLSSKIDDYSEISDHAVQNKYVFLQEIVCKSLVIKPVHQSILGRGRVYEDIWVSFFSRIHVLYVKLARLFTAF